MTRILHPMILLPLHWKYILRNHSFSFDPDLQKYNVLLFFLYYFFFYFFYFFFFACLGGPVPFCSFRSIYLSINQSDLTSLNSHTLGRLSHLFNMGIFLLHNPYHSPLPSPHSSPLHSHLSPPFHPFTFCSSTLSLFPSFLLSFLADAI